MKRIILIFLLIPFLFSSCKPKQENKADKPFTKKKPSLMGTWKMEINASSTSNNLDDDFFSNDEDMNPKKGNAVLWGFYPDGNYTSVDEKMNYIHGTWKFANNKKSITIDNGILEETFNIKVIVGNDKMKLELTSMKDESIKKFERFTELPKEFTLDAFYFTNNLWRIKPNAKENEVQIKKRLCGYIKHVSFILKTAQENNQSSASFEFSEGIIKIYNGGIGVNEETTIPNYWKNVFYNKEAADKGHTLFKNQLQTAGHKIEGTGNWFIDDYNILASVYDKMNAEKLPTLIWKKDEAEK